MQTGCTRSGFGQSNQADIIKNGLIKKGRGKSRALFRLKLKPYDALYTHQLVLAVAKANFFSVGKAAFPVGFG